MTSRTVPDFTALAFYRFPQPDQAYYPAIISRNSMGPVAR